MRHDEPMASTETNKASDASGVATSETLADRAGGDGCHHSSPAPISATTVDRADSPSLEVIPPHSERVALAIRQSMEGGSSVTIDDATEDELALVRYLADELYEPDFVVAAGVDGATGKGWAIVANATKLNPDEGSAVSAVAPPLPIAEPAFSRNPLTDPRAGDIVAAPDGGVIEVVAVDDRASHVSLREDSTCYALNHLHYRTVIRGGRVIHRAEGS